MSDFGVLFVHGMGEQPRGQTLLTCGDPIVGFLDRWVKRDGLEAQGSIEVVATTLSSGSDDDSVPSHARLRVVLPGGGGEQEWMFAESWWGAAVRPPAFSKLAGWLLSVGAWTVLSHMMKRLAGRTGTWAELLRVGSFIVGMIAAIGLQVIVSLLAALAVLPIPALRRALARILLAITGSLGDAYVLVESGLQRSALVERTRAALEWLSARCGRVCVVAHSQGAAIAHLVLRSWMPHNLRAFVTYGSGLGKLDELLCAREARGRMALVARIGPVVLFLSALIAYIVFRDPDNEWRTSALFFIGAIALIALMLAYQTCRDFWNGSEARLQSLGLTSLPPGAVWSDLYGSHDPVSNGPLSPFASGIPGVNSREVENTRNWLTDHTTYWLNRTQFVPAVAQELDKAADSALFGAPDPVIQLGEDGHRRAIRWFQRTRVATLLAALALIPIYWVELLSLGYDIRRFASALKEGFGELGDQVALLGRALLDVLPAYSPTVGTILLGAAVPISLILAWRYVYAYLWRSWAAWPQSKALAGRATHPVDQLTVDATVIGVGLIPLGLVFAYPYMTRIVISRVITGVMATLVGFLFLYGLGSWLVKYLRSGHEPASGRQRVLQYGELAGALGAASMIAWLSSLVVPEHSDTIYQLLFVLVLAALGVKLQVSIVRRMEGVKSWWRPVAISLPALSSLALLFRVSYVRARVALVADVPLLSAVDLLFLFTAVFAFLAMIVIGVIRLATRHWFRRKTMSPAV